MTSSTRGLRTLCLACIVVGLFAALFGLVRRIEAERSSRAIELVVEYPEVEALATSQGIALGDALASLRHAGATAVALPEDTLETLEDEGLITISQRIGALAVPTWTPADPAFAVIASDPGTKNRILQGLRRVYSAQNLFVYPSGHLTSTLLIRGTRSVVSELGLGLSPVKVAHVTQAGLRVVPRLRNIPNATPANLRTSLAAVAEVLPASTDRAQRGIVIFDGTIVPGYRELIPTLADELQANQLVYGCIEFGKQKGDVNLGAKLQGHMVRVHSISTEELATMTETEAVQRFGLAVKDRNIRVLYIRFPSFTGTSPMVNAKEYIHSIAKEITGMRAMGFTSSQAKPAHPFLAISVPSLLLFLLFAGAGAGLLLWLITVQPEQLPRGLLTAGYSLAVLGLIGAAGSAFIAPAPGRMLFGLLAAVGYPLLALTWAYRRIDRTVAQLPVRVVLSAIGALLLTTGITLIGGLLIAAMMGDTRYLVKVGQFSGVKAALAMPLLLFAGLIVSDGIARAGESYSEFCARCRQNIRGFLGQPLYLQGAIIAIVALAAVGLMLMRSGNDSGVDVSTLELKLRAVLDQWMIARPRTKEFILGFPLFLFAMVFAARRQRTLALTLLLGAAIGQVDVLNTYCHAHTPVLLSLLRTFNGLWVGIVIGVVLLALFARHTLRSQPAKIEVTE